MTQLFGTLRTASSSSQTISSALRVISDNIAGSNDKNYDRQIYNFQSPAYVGGVSLTRIIRATAPLLEQIELFRLSDSAQADAISDVYQQISQILGLTNQDKPHLVSLAEDFIEAWHEYHQNPALPSSSSEVIRRAVRMSEELRRISQEIEDLRVEVEQSANRDVESANQLLSQIQVLNERVATVRGRGEASGPIESQRDALLKQLASILRIQVLDRGNGQIAVYAVGDRDPQVNPQTTGHNANRLLDRGFAATFYTGQNGGLRLTGLPNDVDDALWLNDEQNFRLPSGSLLGKLNLLRQNLDEGDSSVGLFLRINQQLDAFANLWTSQGIGLQDTFARAYDFLPTQTPPTNPPEIASEFFVAPPPGGATGRFELTVNPDLLFSPGRLKRIDLHNVLTAFQRPDQALVTLDANGNFIPTVGLDARQHDWEDRTYLEIITELNDHWALVINEHKDDSIFKAKTLETIQQTVASKTGVSLDEELADMTVLQNAYIANTRVLSAAQEMIDALLAIAR